MVAAAVAAERLTKRYGEVVAVDGIDIAIGPGVVHGMLGPNGAGKTTVLAMLFGLLRPDAGTLRLFGRPAEGGSSLDGVAGFVEAPRFYPYLSARRNLEILATLDGLDDRGPVVARCLDDVGLLDVADQKVKGYSLGMRQRLGMAASMLRAPRLLILDEPTNGLDPAGMRDLRASVRQLADSGVTVLLSSHNMAEVEALCDEVTVMRTGRVVFAGSLAEMGRRAPHPSYRLRTADDSAALQLASGRPGVSAARHDDGGLTVRTDEASLDHLIVDLGRSGTAVRRLWLDVTSLESLFFLLTEADRPDTAPLDRSMVSSR